MNQNTVMLAAFADELEKISIVIPGVSKLLSRLGSKVGPSAKSLAAETEQAAQHISTRTGFKIPREWRGLPPQTAAKTVSLGKPTVPQGSAGPALSPSPRFNMPSGGGVGELPVRQGSRQYLPAGKKSWSVSAEELRTNPRLYSSAAKGGLTTSEGMLAAAQTHPGLINVKYAGMLAHLRAQSNPSKR